MLIEPVRLELTELYAPVPKRKKIKPEKYIIRNNERKRGNYSSFKSKLKLVPDKMGAIFFR